MATSLNCNLPPLIGTETSYSASAENSLPVLIGYCSASSAQRGGKLSSRLPALSCLAAGSGKEVAKSSAALSALKITASSLSGGLAKLETNLPVLIFAGTARTYGPTTAAITLPMFSILSSGSFKEGGYKILAVNLKTFGVTEYDNFDFNSFAQIGGVYVGIKDDGIYPLTGSDDNGTDIDAEITTGKLFIEHWRLRDLFIYGLTGGQRRAKLPRGLASGYTNFDIENTEGGDIDLDRFEVMADPVRRKRHTGSGVQTYLILKLPFLTISATGH